MNKSGFIIGILNLINVVTFYFLVLPEVNDSVIIIAWFVVTIVLAITGFCLSKSGSNSNGTDKGLGIAGMALNGLIILPSIVFVIFLAIGGKSDPNHKKITVYHM